jgi:monofunctional biosynthetic peptidoglycan transglycosylase
MAQLTYFDFRSISHRRQPRRRRGYYLLQSALLALVAILLLPYLITPFYLVAQPVSTLMLWRWTTGQRVVHHFVPLSAMAPVLPRTVIASEDTRFCTHRGIDWQELQKVVEAADDIDDLRGGSTITQQVAKNLFLWPGRSYLRKTLELPLALWIDFVLPKRRILEIYLNITEWGPNGEFGAEAGARRAFARSARDLDAHEAALMAAILPNPHRRDARRPGPAVSRLAGLHQRRAAAWTNIDACVRRRAP